MNILKEVIKDIRPGREEEKKANEIVWGVLNKINRKLKYGRAILGGSGAKGTNLKSFDIDIFVKFDYKKYSGKSGMISDILEKTLKTFRNAERLHGSRDYFQIKVDNFTVEIIPILGIKNPGMAKNITDMSPLHADWVLKHRKFQDEIRLTKQFCRAAGAYGAESYLQGFSGYVCEILTIHYGGFLKLLRAATKWKGHEVIDIKKFYKGKDVFKLMNLSKLQSPIIVIDPIQKDRNAAAALSREKLAIFVEAARKFLKKPSKDFFTEKSMLENAKGNVIAFRITPLEGKADAVGAKILKCVEEIERIVGKSGFTLLKKGWEWNREGDAAAVFFLKENSLGRLKVIDGPPLDRKQHVERFRSKYRDTFVKKGRVLARVRREITDKNGLLGAIINNQFIRERCKNIRMIK